MATYAGKDSSFYSATGGVPKEGAWYGSQRYLNGQLLAPGEYEPGKLTSNETIAQTNPDNVSFVQNQRQIQANQIQAPLNVDITSNSSLYNTDGLQDSVNKYRQQLITSLNTEQMNIDNKLATARQKEQDTLGEINQLTTPFRADIEETQREALYINKNFEDNQKLVDELDQLLTEGNNLIKQQSEVTGLASVRNPRIQKTMDDVQARAGVIEAVINARNGQIAQAQNLIDRTINAMTADRQDRISYYDRILNLNNRDILSLDAQKISLAKEQRDIIKTDLENAQATANYVKQLMLDPATASLMGQAGVKLNDSVEVINAKLQQAQATNELRDLHNQFTSQGYIPVFDPSTVPASQLKSFTDSTGKVHYYKEPAKPLTATELNQQAENWVYDLVDNGTTQFSTDDGKTIEVSLNEMQSVESVYESVLKPQFSAAHGTIFTDSYGRQWQSVRGKWVQIG